MRKSLFRDVSIKHWDMLRAMIEFMSVGLGECILTMVIDGRGVQRCGVFEPKLVVEILRKTPNLRALDLTNLPMDRFDPADSHVLQTTAPLPFLTNLRVFSHTLPVNHLLYDLLPASGRRIERLKFHSNARGTLETPDPILQYDFGGRLRHSRLRTIRSCCSVRAYR